MENQARRRLATPPDPQWIFDHALGIYASGRYLIAGNRREYAVAALILVPFSCELFLKCLLRLEGATKLDVHFLDTLFEKLKPNTRSRIMALWDADAKPHVIEFAKRVSAISPEGAGPVFHLELADALCENRNMFERARYWYEFEPGGNAVAELVPVLVRVILESKPEWKAIAAKYTRAAG